jgi:predicted metal-dependent hydrolase
VDYDLRVSPRARYLRVEVPFGGPPLVVAPRRVGRAEVERFVASKRDWIEAQLARQVPVLDLPPLSEAQARRLTRFHAGAVCALEAAALGVSFARIRVGGQRTRWGSCSSTGTLSFNWRLALAPAEVLDYVAVHEVCHLREPNHSRRFWRLVAERRPDWREHREWLTRHGAELLAYEPRLA